MKPIIFPHISTFARAKRAPVSFYVLQEMTQSGIPTGAEARWEDSTFGRNAVMAMMVKKGVSRSHAEFVIAVTQQNPNVPYDLVELRDSPIGEVIHWTAQLTLKRFT